MRTVLVLSLSFILTVAAEVATTEPAPATLTVNGTAEQQALVEWGRQRFEAAGLSLPPLEVSFYGHRDPCQGHPAIYFTEDGAAQVAFCSFGSVDSVASRKTILHELGHAWADAALDEPARAEFSRLRGLEGWNRPESRWVEKGSEHAAEVLAWALMETELRMVTLPDQGTGTLANAYMVLTGLLPPPR